MNFKNLFFLLLAIVLVFPEPIRAQQNLSVRPMRVEADVPPNRVARVFLTVHNRHAARDEPLNLEVVDLTQSLDGTLRIVTEEMRSQMPSEDLPASSRDWVALQNDRVIVPAGTTAEIPVLLSVPADARGVYTSAIRITTDAPPTPEGTGATQEAFFSIRFGFLIPLLTGIAGRPVQQDIRIGELTLAFDDGQNERGERVAEPANRVAMEIINAGRTYSSLRGEIVVERRTAGNWRTVSRVALPERRILPGLRLVLERELDVSLPSGEYRLLGNLSVDGRLMPRTEQIVEFSGDPEADTIAFETQLLLSPHYLVVSGVPGAVRATTVEIENPGDQPMTVQIGLNTPDALSGVAMGDVMGESLSAAEWSQVSPNEFVLRPGQRRNVRVSSRLPREGLQFPNYFADIVLSGTYDDGQSAGETRANLKVAVQGVEGVVSGIIDRFGMALGDAQSQYIAQARFVNNGTVDVETEARVELISASGAVAGSWRLEGAPGPLLPLGVRDFSAAIDVASVEPGAYFLRATVSLGDGIMVTRQSDANVEETGEGSVRVLTFVE